MTARRSAEKQNPGKQAASKRDQTRIRDSKTVNRQFFQKDSNPSKIGRRQPSARGQESLRQLEIHRGHDGNRPQGGFQAHLLRGGPRLHEPQGAGGHRTCPDNPMHHFVQLRAVDDLPMAKSDIYDYTI
ncbi:MAG: hypothetical protein SPC25_04470 [Atopobiaceae bacterium]|nr:hypothetical protein [Atopobiaceae bacterium]